MNIEELNNLKDNAHMKENLNLDTIPELDLYMDQVIQLFEGTFGKTKRTDKDKILTKTMINNYAKDKLLMPIKNKKYSKEHLILMSLIYNLKGSLSINDIKSSLQPVLNKIENSEDFSIRDFYKKYLEIFNKDNEVFEEELKSNFESVEGILDENTDEDIQHLLLLLSFVTMSNFYRRMGEEIISKYFTE